MNTLKRTVLYPGLIALSLVTSAFADEECLQFRVVGVCIWIICTNYGCDISTTIKYGHFNPDTIMYITNPQGIDRAEDPKRIDTHNRNHNNLIFQEAIAFAHPLTGQIYCPSNTSAGEVYFVSDVDYLSWRFSALDALNPAALIPGLRELGNWPKNNWGHVYPRTGWTVLYSEPKSSAVVTHRVGDIITNDNQPHVYDSILGEPVFVEDEKFTWSPDSLIENTNEEGWFQMVSPEFTGCFLVGEDDTGELAPWDEDKKSDDGEYTYVFWRPYTCCEVDDGALIAIDFTPYPFPPVTNN